MRNCRYRHILSVQSDADTNFLAGFRCWNVIPYLTTKSRPLILQPSSRSRPYSGTARHKYLVTRSISCLGILPLLLQLVICNGTTVFVVVCMFIIYLHNC